MRAGGRGIPFIGELCSQNAVDAAQHLTFVTFGQHDGCRTNRNSAEVASGRLGWAGALRTITLSEIIRASPTPCYFLISWKPVVAVLWSVASGWAASCVTTPRELATKSRSIAFGLWRRGLRPGRDECVVDGDGRPISKLRRVTRVTVIAIKARKDRLASETKILTIRYTPANTWPSISMPRA